MMAILEMALWIIATPILLFVGRAWLGFILGLISDPLNSGAGLQRRGSKRGK